MSEPLLSIIVPTYNHENYIEQCINSILMQEVDFEYEVLIGEDCSPDGTRDVLKRLEPNLPECFHIFYRKKNMGMWKNNNADDLRDRARGKYIITIEGDDFWIEPTKLQKQVEFLENNSDYVAVYHKCIPVGKDGKPLPPEVKAFPECQHEEYSFKDYLKIIFPGHLATRMYRREYEDYRRDFEPFMQYEKWPGDNLHPFLQLMNGKVKCFDDKWSAYRHVRDGGTSFSSQYKHNNETIINSTLFYKSLYDYSQSKNNKEAIITSGKLYYWRYVISALGHRHLFSRRKALGDLLRQKYMLLFIGFMIKKEIQLRLNKKE